MSAPLPPDMVAYVRSLRGSERSPASIARLCREDTPTLTATDVRKALGEEIVRMSISLPATVRRMMEARAAASGLSLSEAATIAFLEWTADPAPEAGRPIELPAMR